jgi:dTDP-glucose 4,6-dehydratase
LLYGYITCVPSGPESASLRQGCPIFIDINIFKRQKDFKNIEYGIRCDGIELVMEKGKPGEVYNIGGGNERANVDIVRMILRELGKSESLIEFVKDRPGHDRRYSLDCTKLKKYGWAPKINLNDGIKETVRWYKENEW